jgi:hypothetical protein
MRENNLFAVPSHRTIGKPCKQPLMGYRYPPETMKHLLKYGRVLFDDDHTKIIEPKVYAHEYEDKLPGAIELDGRMGAYELRNFFPEEKKVFYNPKPSALLLQLLSFTAKADAIVLDSFALSGTTAHAVLELNKRDMGKCKVILVECQDYADELTAERVRRAGNPAAATQERAAGREWAMAWWRFGSSLAPSPRHVPATARAARAPRTAGVRSLFRCQTLPRSRDKSRLSSLIAKSYKIYYQVACDTDESFMHYKSK